MSFLDSLKKLFTEVSLTLSSEVQKYRSKDLLQAIVSGSTMIAFADGNASAAEKQKLMGYIRNSEQLKVFDTDKVIESFNQCLGRFEFDSTIATGEALLKVSAFKGKPEAHLIVRVCLAIANADGQFDTSEQRVLEEICNSLDLESSTFI